MVWRKGKWDVYLIVDVAVLGERITPGFTGAIVGDSVEGSHDCVVYHQSGLVT